MNWFTNLKIWMKLACGFGACLVFTAIVGAVAVNRMSVMNADMQAALGDSVGGLHDLAVMVEAARHIRTLEFQYVISQDPDQRAGFESDTAQALGDFQACADDYTATTSGPADVANNNELKALWQTYIQSHHEIMVLARDHQDKQAISMLNGSSLTDFHAYTNQLMTMVQWNTVHGAWYGRQVDRTFRFATYLVVSLIVLSLVVAALLAGCICKLITSPLAAVSIRLKTLETVDIVGLRTAVQAMETGDLTVPVRSETEPLTALSRDEIGAMAGTFNGMLEEIQVTIASFRSSQASLADMVRSIQFSAGQVSTASETLTASSELMSTGSGHIAATMQEVASATDQSARGATEVARGATNQAESLEQGAELVRQLVLAVNSVARDAESTAHSAEHANTVACEGADAVASAIMGMERIRTAVTKSSGVIQGLGEASSQIGAIVETIEEIADQTNLLALNAAIEAARAGDAGRGFAVVADEVRKLAERSRHATQEIGQLIARVQTHTAEAVETMHVGSVEVGKGCDLAQGAGEALAQIKGEMSSVSDQVQSICSAAEEMFASSEEVSRAIAEVSAVVQESSAAAEEMSASSEEVSASVQTVAGTIVEQTSAAQQIVESSLELSRIAGSLKETADRFITGDVSARVVPVAAARKPSSVKTPIVLRKAA
jgi:methyl-accepting chemotaxis protein